MNPIFIIITAVIIIAVIIFVVRNSNRNIVKTNLNNSLDAKDNQRNMLTVNANTKSDDYGFSPKNPIMESTVHSSYVFLDHLYTDDGKKIAYEREGAMMGELNGIEVMIDKYILSVDGSKYKELYICPYAHSLHIAPKGMKLFNE